MAGMAFFRPRTLEDAIGHLSADGEARCIAGGQTLVAMLNANLIMPSALVSLADIAELHGIVETPHAVRVGAMTTHRDVASDRRFSGSLRVIAEAAAQIAHAAIRTMGTIGGSLCHGDAVADYPAAVVAADAVLDVRGPRGMRRIGASDFFKDFLTTDLASDEILVAVELPKPTPNSAGHYLKFARVEGDFATVSVAVTLTLDGRRCTAARVALGGCGSVPVRSDAADLALVEEGLGEGGLARAGAILAAASNPLDDVRGSAEYRRLIIPALVRRAVLAAAGTA
jgi:aerobic carbon-monoxide dehydrogenase medium subunit